MRPDGEILLGIIGNVEGIRVAGSLAYVELC